MKNQKAGFKPGGIHRALLESLVLGLILHSLMRLLKADPLSGLFNNATLFDRHADSLLDDASAAAFGWELGLENQF